MVAMDPGDNFRPSAARVLDALRPDTRMIILNTPNNPTGRVWPEAELRALADGLAARAGNPLVAVHRQIASSGRRTRPPVRPRASAHHKRGDFPARKSPVLRGFCEEPTPGLEPGTPSLRVKCSTN